MTSRERVRNCINKKGMDRLPVKHHQSEGIDEKICKIYGLKTYNELLDTLGDDFRYVQPLREKEANSVNCFDYSCIREQCRHFCDYAIVTGYSNHLSYINEVAELQRGFEQVFIDIAMEDPEYLEIVQRMTNFYYEYFKAILDSGDGKIGIVHIGDDYGSQRGLLISRNSFCKIFSPGIRKIAKLVHEYDAKLMMHCCGGISELIPDFADAGVDILDVVQVSAEGMEIEGLAKKFSGMIFFCGSMDVQSVLINASVAEIRRAVETRIRLFKDGGLILGPSHSIMPGMPIENVLEMYRTVGSMNFLQNAWETFDK